MGERTIIGVDMGGTRVRAGLVRGEVLETVAEAAVPAEASVEDVLAVLMSVIDEVRPAERLDGIGVGVPSVVDVDTGVVYDVQNIPSWTRVPLGARLAEAYDVPVRINNDANCFAWGEYHYGAGRGARSMVGLILGTGFAAGLVLDGHLYSGPHCGAGEVGMIPYRDSIYEYYCCGQFFTRQHGVRGEEVFARAQEGDAEALALWDEFGHHLGRALCTVCYAYDPEAIVFGGSVRQGYPFFDAAMREELEAFAYQASIRDLQIGVSERKHVAILGAAALLRG